MNNLTKISQLKKDVAPYEKIDTKISVIQIINTLGPLLLLWYGAFLSISISYWLTLPIIVLTAGFVVRTFILFHDCCHQSFFKSRTANDILGTITGIITLVPYQQWKNTHNIHHATSGNLDKRGTGDMWLLTVEEYKSSPLWRRIYYRIYRNPLFMLCVGPIAVFLIEYRFNRKDAKQKERINTYVTNGSIVALYTLFALLIGWKTFFLIQGPTLFIASLLGIWLFYVQHQFEDAYFENEAEWSYVQAAVEGSSYYKLPKLLQWITGNIGFHHVHHLSPRVPNYNLEKVHNATVDIQKATTITLRTSFKSLQYRLWDEKNKVLISFKELKQYKSKFNTVEELIIDNVEKTKIQLSKKQIQ